MIAFLGEIMFTSKSKDFDSHQKSKISEESRIKVEPEEVDKLDIKPRQRTDDIKVSWR